MSIHGEKLIKHTVLHNITDDAKFVKVASTALCAKRFLECDLLKCVSGFDTINEQCASYLNVVDVVTVPGGVEELVAKAHDEDVLDHLLTQVVVDTEDLLFLPVGLKGLLELTRALQVLTERLLNLLNT